MKNENIVKNGFATQESAEAQEQMSREEQIKQLGELLDKSPSRQRARFNPDFSLTPEYEALVNKDTSKMSKKEMDEHIVELAHFKKFGTYTDAMRQADIDNSLNIPLNEVISLRDRYMSEIVEIEEILDKWDASEVQKKADALASQYKQRMKGANSFQRGHLKDEYNEAVNALELEELVKPMNALKVKRFEAIEKYKVYKNRIQLYVDCNREAIAKRLEVARDREIDENLLALAEMLEG